MAALALTLASASGSVSSDYATQIFGVIATTLVASALLKQLLPKFMFSALPYHSLN